MKMPYVKFILPTAPTQPVTMNMGMAMPSWYVICHVLSIRFITLTIDLVRGALRLLLLLLLSSL
jgi:hypothetical protein